MAMVNGEIRILSLLFRVNRHVSKFTISIQNISNPDSIEFRIEYLHQLYTAAILILFIYFKSIVKSKADIKDFPKERYNTYAKSCNSNLYTKYPGATYSGLLLGTMRCL